jgi:putative nucleotidyltransferase with HDIG domain
MIDASRIDPDLDGLIVDHVRRGAVKVPPYPAVALRVEQLVRREDYAIDDLASLVASDQALAVAALRCANSSFYSRGTEATSLRQAIGRIGAKEVVRLALATSLGTQARGAGPLATLRRRAWLESLAAAGLCQELAGGRGVPRDEAFLCGLLHDFGKVVAIGCLEDILAAHPELERRDADAWAETVERYHVELGLVLATEWRLPELVVDVLSRHHDDAHPGAVDARVVELVQAADAIVALLDAQASVDAAALSRLGRVRPGERDAVTRVLQELPAFMASFEGELALVPSARRGPEAPAPLAGGVPLECRGDVVAAFQQLRCDAVAIAPTGLVLALPISLPDHMLVEVRLESSPPLACWVTTRRSWSEGGRTRVLLQPFALSPAAHAAWLGLCGAPAQEPPTLEPLFPVEGAPAEAARQVGVLSRMWSAITREGGPPARRAG